MSKKHYEYNYQQLQPIQEELDETLEIVKQTVVKTIHRDKVSGNSIYNLFLIFDFYNLLGIRKNTGECH